MQSWRKSIKSAATMDADQIATLSSFWEAISLKNAAFFVNAGDSSVAPNLLHVGSDYLNSLPDVEDAGIAGRDRVFVSVGHDIEHARTIK